MLQLRPRVPFQHPLWFMRHGATQPNLEGLRCGGDLDVPLTLVGREQVLIAAQRLSAQDPKLHAIVCSPLKRTTESASIVARVLGGTPIEIDEGFRERLLGGWNLQPVEATDDAMRHGVTPPGGEPARDFGQRVIAALHRTVERHGQRRILVLGSKGVARVLRETLPEASPAVEHAVARNAELMLFDLNALHLTGAVASIEPVTT